MTTPVSDHLLTEFIKNTPAAVAMLDNEMRYILVSDRWIEDYGLDEDDIIGRSHYDVFPEIPERWKAIHQRCLAGAVEHCDEDPFVRDDGTTDWIKWRIHPWRNEMDEIGGIIMFTEVITPQKLMQQNLQDVQQRLARLISNISGMVYRCRNDKNWTMEFVSKGATALTGYSPNDLIDNQTLAFADLIHPEDRELVWETVQQALEAKIHFQVVYRIITKSETTKWVWEQGIGVESDEGDIVAVEGLAIDITNQVTLDKTFNKNVTTYRQILENTSDLICLHEPDGTYLYLSPSCESLLGYQPKELIGTNPYDLFHPADIRRIETESHQQALQGQTVLKIIYRIRHKSGEYIWFDTHTKPILDDQGNVVTLLTISRDVSPRIRFTKRLEILHSIDKQILTSSTPSAIAKRAMAKLIDLIPYEQASVGTVDENSQEICILYDSVPENVNQRHTLDWLPQFNQLQYGEVIEVNALNSQTELSPLGQQFLSDGMYGYFCVPLLIQEQVIGYFALGFTEPQDRLDEYVMIATEIAAQLAIGISQAELYKRLQDYAITLEARVAERTAQLHELNQRLTTVLDNVSDRVVLVTDDMLIRQTNEAFDDEFGYSSDEIHGETLINLADEANTSLLERAITSAIQTREVTNIDLSLQRKDGTLFDAAISLSPVADTDLKEFLIVGSIQNITEHKATLASLENALNLERQLHEQKSAFVSIVSHEFRTPLAVINSSVGILKNYHDRVSEEKRQEYLSRVSQMVTNLVQIMDDVLLLSRLEMTKLQFNPEQTDVIGFCEQVIEEVEIGYSQRGKIHLSSQGQCKQASVDTKLLSHILHNLLSNALKYSGEQGQVLLDVSCSSEKLILKVQDQGIGIPKAYQERLFQPFERARNVEDIQGTGIGLTIVKRAVDAHNGTIEVISEENKGTTFIVSLSSGQ